MEDKKIIGTVSLWDIQVDTLIVKFSPISDGNTKLFIYPYSDDYYLNATPDFIERDIERRTQLRDDEKIDTPFNGFYGYIAEFLNGIHLVINSITAPEPSLFTISESEVTVNEMQK